MKNKIIAVDFDGTLCVNKYPEIGDPNEELIAYLKKRQANGEKLILWTNRVDDRLDEAVKWCAEHGLMFDAVNDNLPESIFNISEEDMQKAVDVKLQRERRKQK